jgi:hypothetical protein
MDWFIGMWITAIVGGWLLVLAGKNIDKRGRK